MKAIIEKKTQLFLAHPCRDAHLVGEHKECKEVITMIYFFGLPIYKTVIIYDNTLNFATANLSCL